ncbi:MAG: hypothetical protein ABI760_15400 [Ferruginibacter sp.]
MDILNDEFLIFLKCAQQNRLNYMLIGGYAVNYYGFNRNTKDMDVWIAPTNENKVLFINTLLCMKYSENEVAPLYEEDFTQPFVGSFGTEGSDIDILTIVHHAISYYEAEKDKNVFEILPGLFMNLVPYDFLIDMKLRSRRDKDLWDISQLEKLRNKK